MNLKRFFYCLISVALLKQVQSQAVFSAANEVNFEQYGIEQGLIGKNVFKVYQDRDGFLWIPSTAGISRFDGLNFINFTKQHGLLSNTVGSVIQDKNNVIWLGTSKGLVIYKNRKFTAFDTSLKMPSLLTWTFFEDTDKTIWAGTGQGLYHLNPDNLKNPLIKHYIMPNGINANSVRAITRNNKGSLLAGTDQGIYILTKDTFLLYADYGGRGYSIINVNDSTEWTCGWESNVYEIVNGKQKRYIQLGSAILSITKVSDTEIWLASWDKGVYKFDGQSFINYDYKQGLNYSSFWGAYSDKEGNVWFSSWGRGVFKYSGERFTKITDKSGLTDNNLNGIHKSSDGKLWFSTESGLSYVDTKNNNFKKSFTEIDGKKLSKIICSAVMSNNEVFAFGYGGYGYRIKNEKIISSPTTYGQSSRVDHMGNLIVGYEGNGAVRYNRNGTTDSFYVGKKGIINTIEGISEDHQHHLWFRNTYNGINYFNGKRTIHFNSKNGFINEPGNYVCSDIKGNYWIATEGRGVLKCNLVNDSTLVIRDSITTAHGLFSDYVSSVQIHKGKLYMTSDGGLNVLDLKLYDYKHAKSLASYNKSDGFVSSECRIAFFNENGSAWFQTDKGAYFYDPYFDKKNTNETKNHLLGIKLFLKEVNWLNYADSINSEGIPFNLSLSYNKNHLAFSFVGICFNSPLKVKYKYKLEGLDKEWSPEVETHEAVYSSIPPGTYTFMVMSCNNDGVWNSQPTTYTFTITPPFWKTNWFMAIIAVFAISIIYLYISAREKKLKLDKQILEGKVKERTEELKGALEIVEEKQKEILDSITYAKRIQSAYLPPEQVFHQVLSDAFLLFKPKDIVSGDFYWFYLKDFDINTEIIYCAVADCTGHGVPGALMSVICCNALNEAVVTQEISDTDKILNEARRLVKRNLKSNKFSGQKDGMDIALIKFNKKTGELWYSGAYNPLWIISEGELIELVADKQPIGIHEIETDFIVTFRQLKKNDVVYLFSDGFADQFGGAKGKKFKYKSLAQQMVLNYQKPMQEQKEILLEAFENWRGNLEQVDDVCIIGIRF